MVAQKQRIKVVLKKVAASDKEGYLFLRVKIPNKKQYEFKGLGHKVAVKNWDAEHQRVKRGQPGHEDINADIEGYRIKIMQDLQLEQLKGRTITQETIKVKLKGKEYNLGSFVDFFALHVDYIKTTDKDNKTRLSKGYIDHWDVEYNQLAEFTGGQLEFEDVTAEWLEKYEAHISKRISSTTTLSTKMKRLRQIINKAIAMDKMRPAQIAGYKWPVYKAPERQYLTLDETDKIWSLLEKDDVSGALQKVCAFFLVECYSGVRFSDWSKFKVEKLIEEENFRVRAKKNGEPVYLPLRFFPRLQKVLNYIKDHNLKYGYSEQDTNRRLKDVAALADIDLRLTTHVGRHTAATLLAELGYGAKDIGEVLGISEQVAKTYMKQTRKGLLNTLERFGGL